jgi:hypothetical protein
MLGPGPVEVVTPDNLSLVEVRQGSHRLLGKIVRSKNTRYAVVMQDGLPIFEREVRKWVPGVVCLIEGNNLVWIIFVEKPINASVSDEGTTAILYTIRRDYSKPRSSKPEEGVDLGGTLAVLNKTGEQVLEHKFGSNVHDCTISSDGNLIVLSTLYPDNSTYCFSVSKKEMMWKRKNDYRRGVTGFEFTEKGIEVFSSPTIGVKEKECVLGFDGTLPEQYTKEREKFNGLRKATPEVALDNIISILQSDNKKDIADALLLLESLVSKKKAIPYYPKIIALLRNYLQANHDALNSLYRIIRTMLKNQPQSIEPIVPDILTIAKQKEDVTGTILLGWVRDFGETNPKWVENEIPIIIEQLKSSKRWNQRRWAAFAVGSIGSKDFTLIQSAIPVLIDYVANPDRVRSQLEELARKDKDVAIDLMVAGNNDPATWLRDACIDALGMIGKTFPHAVKDAVALLQNLASSAPSPYTMKKAKLALDGLQNA